MVSNQQTLAIPLAEVSRGCGHILNSSVLNRLISRPTLFWNKRVCASDCAKAEALNQQYESVFTGEDLCSTPSLGPSPYPDIPELFVSESGIMKLLQNIDTSKAAGPDLLRARILKEAAVELTLILTALFRQTYDSGLLPADWNL